MIVDYGLSESLPQAIPVAAHNGRRGKPGAGDEAAVH